MNLRTGVEEVPFVWESVSLLTVCLMVGGFKLTRVLLFDNKEEVKVSNLHAVRKIMYKLDGKKMIKTSKYKLTDN